MNTKWLRDECSFMAVAPTARCCIARSSSAATFCGLLTSTHSKYDTLVVLLGLCVT